MQNRKPAALLSIDPSAAVARIVEVLRSQLASNFKRKGYVVGMSSGVDSSVTAALAVHAIGPTKVFGIFMPERESDPTSRRSSRAPVAIADATTRFVASCRSSGTTGDANCRCLPIGWMRIVST
jgi:NH3-dependent NAD+ synthetase